MPIAVRCDQCGFSRTVPDEFAGRQGKCPQCGAAVRVPAKQQPAAGVAPKTITASKEVAVKQPTAKAPAAPKVTQVARRLPTTQSTAMPSAKSAPVTPGVAMPPAGDSGEIESPNYTAPTDEPDASAPEPEGDTSWADMVTSSASSKSSSRSRRTSTTKRTSARKPAKEEAAVEEGSPRRKKKPASALPIPAWAIAAILGGVLLAVGGGVYFAMTSDNSKPVAKAKKSSKPKAKASEPKEVLDTSSAGKMKSPEELGLVKKLPEDQRPAADAPLEDIFAWVKPGIVVIEIFSGGQQIGMGSGFVVDSSGVIVTNYHVSSPGDAAYVKFTDDTRYEVSGYLAVKPEWDLAVLQLKDKPANLRVLNLVHDKKPREASKVMAVGSPLGHTFVPTSGIVGRVVQATDLPPGARHFVLHSTGQDEQFWIEHDAKIAPGNSGGPLFNMAGDVVGVNSWVDTQVSFGYAIWSWYVHDLLSHKLPQTAPLSQYKKADASLSSKLAGSDVTAESLQKFYDECEAMKWQPKDAAQYRRVQEFAKVLSVARYADKVGLPKDVSGKAVEVSAKLAGTTWSPAEHIEPINKLATAELSKPTTGTMLFGTIKAKQTSRSSSGPITLLVMTIEGSTEIIAVPVTGVEAAFKEGTSCLMLGIVSTNRIAYATPGEGRVEAYVLEAPIVLPVKKASA